MNAYNKFHAHHVKLIQQIGSLWKRTLENPADASLLVSYCRENLIPHAEAEEEALYVEVDDESLIKDMVGEHEEIKSKLITISEAHSAANGETVVSECGGFLHLMEGHFDKEENEIVSKLRTKFTQENFLDLIDMVHDIESIIRTSNLGELYEADHRRIEFNVSLFRKSWGNIDSTRFYYRKFRNQLLQHIVLEEEILFPVLFEYTPQGESVLFNQFTEGHRHILSILSAVTETPDDGKPLNNLDKLLECLMTHSQAEENMYLRIGSLLPSRKRKQVFRDSFEGFSQV